MAVNLFTILLEAIDQIIEQIKHFSLRRYNAQRSHTLNEGPEVVT